jgi:hypothetical protein
MIFPWVKPLYLRAKATHKKIRVDPARNWLVTVAYKQQLRISGNGSTILPVGKRAYPSIKEKSS